MYAGPITVIHHLHDFQKYVHMKISSERPPSKTRFRNTFQTICYKNSVTKISTLICGPLFQ